MPVYESHFEEAALDWFAELGYRKVSGYDIAPAPDGATPERANYKQVILVERLRAKLIELNPSLPPVVIADAVHQIRREGRHRAGNEKSYAGHRHGSQ